MSLFNQISTIIQFPGIYINCKYMFHSSYMQKHNWIITHVEKIGKSSGARNDEFQIYYGEP